VALASGWPTSADVAARAKVTLTDDETSYGLNVATLLERAYWWAAEYCRRDRELGFDEATVTEKFDGGIDLFVKHPPIVSVTSVTDDEEELTVDDDYYVYDTYIHIVTAENALERRYPLVRTPQVVEVVYVGGYSDSGTGTHKAIPHELKEIVLEVAVRWLLRIHEQYRMNRLASRVSIGEYTAVFPAFSEQATSGRTRTGGIMEDLKRRLDHFVVGGYW